jgi:hypothetical protein
VAETIEVRCPLGPRKLFTKLQLGEEAARYVQPDNLIEFTCADCARRITRQHQQPVRVYHRFNFIGELIETLIEQRSSCATGGG